MKNKVFVLLLLVAAVLCPVSARGEIEPPDRTHPIVEEVPVPEVPDVAQMPGELEYFEIILDDLLKIFPDTVQDPDAVVVGYRIAVADMPVTFPYSVVVTEKKDCYNASDLGLVPVLWNGDEYVTKAWFGMSALNCARRNGQSTYLSTLKSLRFIVIS